MSRRPNTLLTKMVDTALDADQKHHMYRSFPPGALVPDEYQCTGCETVFTSHDSLRRHRLEAIVNSLLDFLAGHRDR